MVCGREAPKAALSSRKARQSVRPAEDIWTVIIKPRRSAHPRKHLRGAAPRPECCPAGIQGPELQRAHPAVAAGSGFKIPIPNSALRGWILISLAKPPFVERRAAGKRSQNQLRDDPESLVKFSMCLSGTIQLFFCKPQKLAGK